MIAASAEQAQAVLEFRDRHRIKAERFHIALEKVDWAEG
jgi:hypothetical protein